MRGCENMFCFGSSFGSNPGSTGGKREGRKPVEQGWWLRATFVCKRPQTAQPQLVCFCHSGLLSSRREEKGSPLLQGPVPGPRLLFGQASARDRSPVPATEYQLVPQSASHHLLWTVCCLYLRELLFAGGDITPEREEAFRVLSLIWQLLPANRLRQIRYRLIRFPG